VRTSAGWVTPRPDHQGLPYQDGYFFGYGRDYKQALRDLRALTGPADMLPKWAFGVWYSRYYPYTTSDPTCLSHR
jgi:alpha-glucosidase (family GH31 glycosyl hydrolase)